MDERVDRPDFDTTHAPVSRGPVVVVRRSRTRWVIGLIVVLLGVGAVWFWQTHHAPQTAGRGAPGRGAQTAAQPVGAETIGTGDIRIILNELGTVTPLANVTVKTQINGQLTEVAFKEGQSVKVGDFLAQIDPRPYQVALEQAQGTLAHDQALLEQAQNNLKRYQTLARQDSIAQQQADDQRFLVAQYQGSVQTDQGQVDSAKLNLIYCHIVAPVAGRVGLRQVDAGNYVQTSDANGLVVITQEQPISVIFSVTEDNLPAVMKQLHAGAKLQVEAYDRSNATLLATGTLSSVDNQINTTTGTVNMRADFPNTDETLFPNQFVNAHVLVDTLHNVVRVPVPAVQQGAPGSYVYVINQDDTVSVRPIKVGPIDGGQAQVISGLSAGDRVVTDGTDRLRDGQKVTIPPPPSKNASSPRSRRRSNSIAVSSSSERNRDHRMSPSRIFILRPVGTWLLMAAIVLVGIVAYGFLPVSALPEVDYPTIQVQTLYPGASPEVMTSSVTAPLERQFGQMPGLNQMSSVSSAGASVITLQFSLDLSLDIAEQEVQAAINAAGNLLPSDLPAPPIYAKVNPADAPILTIALTSKTLPLTQLENLADTRLAQKISQQPGVGIGQHQRRTTSRGAHPGQSSRVGGVRAEHRRSAHDVGERQRQHPEGKLRRAAAGHNDQCQ